MERRPAGHWVSLSWRDRHGDGFAYGTCRDISRGGISIECLEPIPMKAPVTLRLGGGGGRVSSAVIRYRAKRGSGYVLGLEFTRPKGEAGDRKRDELDMATEGMTW